ncbi:MAG TPA: geranylgeranylglyceryl/heptaprenylglyceryl phosphate synthase, partial [Thermoplasmata archaeon]|nr:geranylgeranylglyceryl/heptaprenylglyceryl phosphate synthase [Thermoplasmata archaeon]
KVVSVPLIVGGGIRTPEQAKIVAESGADIVVTGTVVEESGASSSLLSEIIRAVKGVNINISKI